MNKSLLLSGLFFVSSLANSASLNLPNALEVSAVNGQQQSHVSTLQLDDGSHIIELQYIDNHAVNAEHSGPMVKSAPLYLAVDIDHNNDYQVQLPDIHSQEAAYEYLQKPSIHLHDASGMQRKVSLMTHHQLIHYLLVKN